MSGWGPNTMPVIESPGRLLALGVISRWAADLGTSMESAIDVSWADAAEIPRDWMDWLVERGHERADERARDHWRDMLEALGGEPTVARRAPSTPDPLRNHGHFTDAYNKAEALRRSARAS